MLELAHQSKDGQLYTCTAALFFSAFMLEAYFNHIGQERHGEKWEIMEKSKAWKSKYSKFKNFAAEAGWTVDDGLNVPPYCSVREIFEFRDALAHGRTTVDKVVNSVVEDKGSLALSLPGPDWHDVATLEITTKLFEDAVALVKGLHVALKLKGQAFLSSGGGLYVISPLHDKS